MTNIEWTRRPGGPPGQTWNCWWGCDKIAPECGLPAPGNPNPVGGGCYAAVMASRNLPFNPKGTAAKGEWNGVLVRTSEKQWRDPFSWPPGTLVFTCSQSDFFHERVPLQWLDDALDVIEATQWLTYQILTKRPGMIARRLADLNRRWPSNAWCGAKVGHPQSLPLLKPLRRVEASVRFLSVEPLLAPMVPGLDLDGIHWVIAGGESGHHARPCDPDRVRAVRDLCVPRDVPFFMKQWGKWRNNPTLPDHELDPPRKGGRGSKGGATLDGRLWRQFPEEGSR